MNAFQLFLFVILGTLIVYPQSQLKQELKEKSFFDLFKSLCFLAALCFFIAG
jgi:hypothetical protein